MHAFQVLLALQIIAVLTVLLVTLSTQMFVFNAQLQIVKDAIHQLLLNANSAAAQLIWIHLLSHALHAQLLALVASMRLLVHHAQMAISCK